MKIRPADSFVYGVKPILEQLKAGADQLVEIYVATSAKRPSIETILVQARAAGVKINFVPAARLGELAESQQHQGVVARVHSYRYASFENFLHLVENTRDGLRILLLDEVNDPRNFGALLRTADASGVRHVIIPQDRSVAVTPIVIKTSAGAALHLQIYRVTNLRRAMQSLKSCGFWFVGLTANANNTIYQQDYPERLGIIVGSEGSGLRPLIERECDYKVAIPMLGQVQSLNVSVAGAVCLYEIVRQDIATKGVKSAAATGRVAESK